MVLSCKFAFAQVTKPGHPDPVRNPNVGMVLIDADTDKVIYAYKADERFQPASMTKMMTAYLVFDALKSGKLKLDDQLSISKNAQNQTHSEPQLVAGQTISVKNALLALMLPSSNDAAVVLAEKLGGSVSGFSVKMNAKAREFGMTKTQFSNPSGWESPRQWSTPNDMATLLKRVRLDHPDYYNQFFGLKQFTYKGDVLHNHNRLQMQDFEGMTGGKTGYFSKAGSNLAACVERDGHRLIGVVQKGSRYFNRDALFAEMMEYGFLTFKDSTLAYPMKAAEIYALKKQFTESAAKDSTSVAVDTLSQRIPLLLRPVSSDGIPATLETPAPVQHKDTVPGPQPVKYEAILRRG